MTIKEIKSMGDKAPIAVPVTAVLSEAYDRKTGIGKFNKSVQRVKLTQGDDFIFCEVENHDDLSGQKGNTITISPSQDKEGNPTGLYAHKTEWKDTKYDNLRVTKSASITMGGTPPVTQGGSAPKKSTPVQSDAKVSVKAELNKMANLMLMCYQAGDYLKSELKDMSAEAYEQKVTCLFIEANKRGLAHHCPIGTLNAPAQSPTPPPEPELDDEDDVPF